ncbi:NUT family member 2F [Marmota monax]|nr:NUT family member 2F [Marmota monax]
MGALPAVGNPPSALAPAPCPAGAPTEAGAVGAAWERALPANHVRMREGCRRDPLREHQDNVEASASQRPDMNVNPGAHMSAFRGLPFLPAAPVPTHQPFWELPLAPRVTAPISQSNPLVLSTYPGQPYVPGLSTFGQHGPQLRPAGPPHIQNIAHTQAPLNFRAPGAFCGGVEHPAPFLTAPSAPRTTVPASASGGIQNYGIHWHLGLRPPAPQPFAQLAPIMFPMDARQWPGTGYGAGAPPIFPSAVPPDDSGGPPSVYEDFRRWQRFKTLVRRHLPQTPDVEALSCFLVPVLRSLSRREPTMTMEEGLRKGLQEWQRTSNFDRMVFYETSQKFMEFEAAEEMEDPRMQLSGVFQCRPPPVPPMLQLSKPPVLEAFQRPGCRKTSPKLQPACSLAAKPKAPETKVPETKARKTKARKSKVAKTNGPETKAPEEIPPEAIQEYMDIMDELCGPTSLATWEPSHLSTEELAEILGEEGLEHQPIEDLYPDPSLLSYVDEDFVNKVGHAYHLGVVKAESIIHPRFLEEILSSEPSINILALTKELDQEEGLTPDQVDREGGSPSKPACKEAALQGPQGHGMSQQDSRASQTPANQGAEKRKHHTDQGAGMEDWSTEVASQVMKRRRAMEPELLGSKDSAVLQGRHWSSSLGNMHSNHPPHNCRSSSLNLGNKGVVGPRKATSSGRPHKTANGCSVDDDLQSLDFLLNSQNRLLPWGLSQSQAPQIETLCSGDQPLQAAPPQRGRLSSHPPPGAMTMKSVLTGRSCNVEKMPCTGPPLQVIGGQGVDLELGGTSQPQKRKCVSSGNQKKKRP